MTDRPLAVTPAIPSVNVAHIEQLADQGEIITLDGEILAVADAESEDLIAWVLIAKRMREIARRIDDMTSGEMLMRCREVAGPIDTAYGTARESVSRGSISGIASERVRAILEEAAEDGAIPWEAVDNVAPLKPHVTPAKLADYAETIRPNHTMLAEAIDQNLPEKRRTLKVEERLV